MLEQYIEEEGLDLKAILLTHAHLDHVEGISDVRARHPSVPIWLHPDDLNLYRGVQQQAAMFGLAVDPQPEPTDELIPGEPFHFGDCTFEVLFAPGHSPGHVVFVSQEDSLALVGDVVFEGSIGRTDLPGGSFETLMASIQREILSLPDETTLFPGHGPTTSVGQERKTNPFLVPHYGGGLV
jgi:glyoxylase-like metal-dependent hydrolase (beta-lactamase superfamily II)